MVFAANNYSAVRMTDLTLSPALTPLPNLNLHLNLALLFEVAVLLV